MLHAPGVLEVLRIAPLFRGVPQDLLAKNLSQTKVRHLKPGEILLVPGKANKVMYIILAGRLNIQTKEANVEPIAVLGEGECVGEMSVLGDAPVSAYVIAATECKLLSIGNTAIWELINNSHKASHNMLIILTDRLRQTNQLMAENIGRDQDVANGSVVDELTGLYNQRWTQQRLNRLLHRASVDKKENCLMMLEADHLKEFCDQFGQLGGDQALRDIAYTMLACLRPDDQAGRHLGERFVAFLPNTSLSDACIAAERLRLVVSESMVVLPSGDALPPVSISIGVTSVQSDDTVVKLLARASKALLLARDHGGNCIRFTE